jgi:hypothetical protein
MPNAKVHAPTGLVLGAANAFRLSQGQPDNYRLVETLSGAFFGATAGLIPDRIDPPDHPNHRAGGHGAVQTIALAYFANKVTPMIQEKLRGIATSLFDEAQLRPESFERSMCQVGGVCYLILSGALPGITAGYASHVALDAFTPKSIPFIGIE